MKKGISILAAIILLAVAGCQILNDFWPAKLPQDLKTYSGVEPNNVKLWDNNLGKLKDLKEAAVTKHISSQLDLKFGMEKDQAYYDRAIAQANINIQQAEQERAELLGSIDKPGLLMLMLLGGTGIGAYITGLKTQRPTDYSPTEVKELLAKAKNGAEVVV
jgi:hypothetical protein